MSTWRGQHGAVILGPTEDRVARYLEHMTKHGRITLRTVELAQRLGLERSEAYRITARLRVLGLFGIANDRGGAHGGRRIWRTAIERASPQPLDPVRHRTAWARVVAYLRARRSTALDSLARLRQRRDGSNVPAVGSATPAVPPTQLGWASDTAGGTVATWLRRYGAGALLDEWGVS